MIMKRRGLNSDQSGSVRSVKAAHAVEPVSDPVLDMADRKKLWILISRLLQTQRMEEDEEEAIFFDGQRRNVKYIQ